MIVRRLIQSLFALTLLGMPVQVSAQDQPVLFADIDPQTPCKAASDNPICALKTWFACEFTDSPIACRAVGHEPFDLKNAGDRLDEQFEDDVRDRPWTLPMSYIFGYGPQFAYQPGFNLVGYRLIDQSRFASVEKVPAGLSEATHEVMFTWVDESTDKQWYDQSVFMVRRAEAWHVVGASYWKTDQPSPMGCDYSSPPDERRYCDLYVLLPKWPDDFVKFSRAVGQDEPYRSIEEMKAYSERKKARASQPKDGTKP